jgi:hypothetical protein
MKTIKKHHFFQLASAILLWLWAGLSIYGAFLGSRRAASFYQSFPLSVFWGTCLVFLFLSLFRFRFWTQSPLFLLHLGTLLVLGGGLWGSPAAAEWRNRLWGISEISKGYLILSEKEPSRTIFDFDGREIGTLPYDVCLEQAAISYYDAPSLLIQDANTLLTLYTISNWQEGPVELQTGLRLEVVERYENLQMHSDEEQRNLAQGPAQAQNPGFRLKLIWPDGKKEDYYVSRKGSWGLPSNRCVIRYCPPAQPRQYESRISIRENKEKSFSYSIQVNRPLFYRGYTFYQHSLGRDSRKGLYSIIGVVNNRGVIAVFMGYLFLVLGAIGHFWCLPLVRKHRKEHRYSS